MTNNYFKRKVKEQKVYYDKSTSKTDKLYNFLGIIFGLMGIFYICILHDNKENKVKLYLLFLLQMIMSVIFLVLAKTTGEFIINDRFMYTK